MPEYNSEAFYVHSTDKRGHSVSVRFALPPDQHHRVMKLVHDARTPYDTPQDFVRDAVVHRCAMLEKWLPDAHDLLTISMVAQRVAQRVAALEASEQIVERYRELAMKSETKYERLALLDEVTDVLTKAGELGIMSRDIDRLEDIQRMLS